MYTRGLSDESWLKREKKREREEKKGAKRRRERSGEIALYDLRSKRVTITSFLDVV